jgi:hypothetical protein
VTADFQKLVLYDFSTRKWEDLVKMNAGYPSWSKDGKCAYFNDTFEKTGEYRVCLSDRKAERIVDLSEVGNLAQGRFGWWTGLGPDDSILGQRNISVEEIYALDTKFPYLKPIARPESRRHDSHTQSKAGGLPANRN